jgi:hypothetical protein
MDDRRMKTLLRNPMAGLITAAMGVMWEGVKVAHNISYFTEIVRHLDWTALRFQLWQPSPLVLVALGAAWASFEAMAKKKSGVVPVTDTPTQLRTSESEIDGLCRLIASANNGKDGTVIEIHEDIRSRTVYIRVGANDQ